MDWSDRCTELRDLLAQLIDDRADARRIALDALNDIREIDISGSPVQFWQAIIESAIGRAPPLVIQLIDQARRQYEERQDLVELRASFERNLAQESTENPLGNTLKTQLSGPLGTLVQDALLVIVYPAGHKALAAKTRQRIADLSRSNATMVIACSGSLTRDSTVQTAASSIRSILLTNTIVRSRQHLVFCAFGRASKVVARLLIDDIEGATVTTAMKGSRVVTGTAKRLQRRLGTAPMILMRTRGIFSVEASRHSSANSAWGRDLLSYCEEIRAQRFPTPSHVELSVSETSDSVDQEEAVNEALQDGSAIRQIVLDQVARYKGTPDLTVAYATFARSFEIDARSTLIGIDPPRRGDERAQPTVNPSSNGSQYQIVDALRKRVCGLDALHDGRVVVTGDAGVGKTIVLRGLAQDLASEYLTGTDPQRPLPIIIPLQQIEREDVQRILPGADAEKAASWEFLKQYWCAWATQIVSGLVVGGAAIAIEPSWLDERLRRWPTTLILDGLDEFLVNHPAIGLDQFLQLLSEIEARFALNRGCYVVIGVRSTQPGLNLIGRDAGGPFEIVRPTTSQAEREFPGARALIKRVKNPKLRDLLLTPLILVQLGPLTNQVDDERLTTRTGIMGVAVESIVQFSRLPGQQSVLSKPTYLAQWIEALAIVAWIFYSRRRASIARDELTQQIAALSDRWRAHLNVTGQTPLAQELVDAFAMLSDQQLLSRLLSRTVFTSIGRDVFRVLHKEWEQFLASRYIAECMRLRFVGDFELRAFLNASFRTAGELLAKDLRTTEFDETFATDVLSYAAEPARQFVIVNTAAVLGNGTAAVSGDAVRAYLLGIADKSDIVRHVTLNTFCFRSLHNDPTDSSSSIIRREVVRALPLFHTEPYRSQTNPVTVRLAWAMHKVMSRMFEGVVESPNVPWPGTEMTEAEEMRAMQLVAVRDGDSWRLDNATKSIQIALALMPFDVVEDYEKIPSAVFYLYPMVLAAEFGAITTEADQLLGELFAEDSVAAKLIADYKGIRELSEVFAYCRQLYDGVRPSRSSTATKQRQIGRRPRGKLRRETAAR